MTVEQKLKDRIKHKYDSVHHFALSIDIPYTTICSILSRGIATANVLIAVRMCKALRIDIVQLLDGKIVELPDPTLNKRIEHIIAETKTKLRQPGILLNHKVVYPDVIVTLCNDIQHAMALAQETNENYYKAILEDDQ